jgi:protein-disulfide isomerase
MGKNVKENQKLRRQRARNQQLIIIGGVVVVAVVLIGLSVARSAYENAQPVGNIIPIQKETYALANGKTLGAQDAKVVIQEFADFQCPYCGRFALTTEKNVIDSLVATGNVRFEYHHFIVVDGNTRGTESRRAAEASECANEQGEFWNFQRMVFTNQNGEGKGAFADRRLKAFAETLGLDTAAFNTCFDSSKYAQAVQADERMGASLGINSTPSLFVNGQPISNPLDFNEIQSAVQAALGAAN